MSIGISSGGGYIAPTYLGDADGAAIPSATGKTPGDYYIISTAGGGYSVGDMAVVNATSTGYNRIPDSSAAIARATAGYGVTMRVFGDSTTDNSNSWADQWASEFGGTLDDQSLSGDSLALMLYKAIPLSVGAGAITAIQDGVNDAVLLESQSQYLQMFRGMLPRMMLHHLIPDSKKLDGDNSRVTFTGSWSGDTKFLGGTVNRVTTTNGDSVEFTAYGTAVYIATRLKHLNSAGQISVTIDGVSYGTVNLVDGLNAESSLSSVTYNQTPTVLRYGGLTETMHTVTITVTSSTSGTNQVWFDWGAGNMDWAPSDRTSLFWCNGTRKTPAAYSGSGGSDSALRELNEAAAEWLTILAGDGFNVVLVPFAAHYDPNIGSLSSDGTHPNTDGKAAQYAAFRGAWLAWRANRIPSNWYPRTLTFGSACAQSGVLRVRYTDTPIAARNLADSGDIAPLSFVAGTLTCFGGLLTPDSANNRIYIGATTTTSSPPGTLYIGPAEATGTNVAGSNVVLRAGRNTGNADGGYLAVEVYKDGTSGTTQGTAYEAMRWLKGVAVDVKNANGVSARLGGTLKTSYVAYSNVGTGAETAASHAIGAGALSDTGDQVSFTVMGLFSSNANNKRVRVLFGSAVLFDSGAGIAPQGAYVIEGRVVRTGATSQRAWAWMTCDSALITSKAQRNTTAAETLANSITLAVEVTGAAAGDTIVDLLNVHKITAR